VGARGVGRSGLAVGPRASAPPPSPATPTADEADDLLAGATIVVHDLSRPSVPPRGLDTSAPPLAPDVGVSGTAVQQGTAQGLSPYWRRLQAVVGGGLVALCLGLFGYQFWLGRSPTSVTFGALGAGSGSRVEIKVHIDGAVTQPGVYRLAQGDRVEDAIRAAGGLAPNADGARLNLAQRVRDEQRLDVPTLPLLPGAPSSPQGAASQGAPSAAVPLAAKCFQ